MKKRLLGATAALSLVAAGVAVAGGSEGKLLAQPGVFDPLKTGTVEAYWHAKIGLPDAGQSDHGLRLEKNAATAEPVAAGAALKFVEGEPFEQMGYDIRDDSPWSGGAPRFNVLTAAGTFHFVGGCANDDERHPVPGHPGWTRVRFESDESFPPIPTGAIISSATLIVDEEGRYTLDNIYVNGDWAKKPGANTRRARR